MALGGGDASARGRKGEQRRRRGGRSQIACWRGGRGAPASAAGKRGRRDGEEKEKGRGPAGRGAVRGGEEGISRQTAVGRRAAQVLPTRGGKGRKGKKNKGEREKKEKEEKNIPKNRDGKGIPSLFRDGKQIPSLFRGGKKKSVSKIRDEIFSVSI